MDRVQKAFEDYKRAVESGPDVAGDFAAALDDETAKAVYELCELDPQYRDRLVRPLWFNYATQSWRW